MHEPPPVPHAASEGVVQLVPVQQPFGQEAALQTHCPPSQAWPPAQPAFPPQVQAPAMQPSACLGSQAMHAPPSAPQAASDGFVHALPEQQPAAQLCALHAAASTIDPSL